MRIFQKDIELFERIFSGQSWNKLSNNINKIILDYNPMENTFP